MLMESIASIDLKWGKTFRKIFSETMKPTTSSPINSANHVNLGLNLPNTYDHYALIAPIDVSHRHNGENFF